MSTDLLKLISDAELKRIIEEYPPPTRSTCFAAAKAEHLRMCFITRLTDEADRRKIDYQLKKLEI